MPKQQFSKLAGKSEAMLSMHAAEISSFLKPRCLFRAAWQASKPTTLASFFSTSQSNSGALFHSLFLQSSIWEKVGCQSVFFWGARAASTVVLLLSSLLLQRLLLVIQKLWSNPWIRKHAILSTSFTNPALPSRKKNFFATEKNTYVPKQSVYA